jgi:multidrug efflux pump subunit AcrB
MTDILGLGNLLLAIAFFFTALIVIFECVERRREGKRERKVLEEIEREYHAYFRVSRP